MRHLRWIVLAAVAVALWVAPVAGAHDSHKGRGGAVVAPAKDKWLTMHALMEQMGLTDTEEGEEPTPVREDGDSSNLSDIIF